MGYQAIGTILDTIIGIHKIASAFISQAIQRTVAEETAKFVRLHTLMAGEKFTFLILEKIVMGHKATSLENELTTLDIYYIIPNGLRQESR